VLPVVAGLLSAYSRLASRFSRQGRRSLFWVFWEGGGLVQCEEGVGRRRHRQLLQEEGHVCAKLSECLIHCIFVVGGLGEGGGDLGGGALAIAAAVGRLGLQW